MSNIPWAGGDPNNGKGNEDGAILANYWGVGDTQINYPSSVYGPQQMLVICQFAPIQWKYLPNGHGRFAVPAYQISRTTVSDSTCVTQCHLSLFCVSFAYNPTTKDCQLYAVSPQDPRLIMVRLTRCSLSIGFHILQLMLIYNLSISAAVLTYDGCMSDSAHSYTVGGWCFLLYTNSSWPLNTPTQDGAHSVCLPYGTLAVGVTYKMLNTFKPRNPAGTNPHSWLGLVRNTSYSARDQGWYWKTLLPTGTYATFPAIMSNIPWGPGEPNNNAGNEDGAILVYNHGVGDVRPNISLGVYASLQMSVICQFAPIQWRYLPHGHGRFAVPAYQIAQKTVENSVCIAQCHLSVFCLSLAFNPTTNDCQIYGVSPEDPKFSGDITIDSSYDLYIRDGMEY
uniref:Apple domain-containing protein n=1 Tax=Plectus sambesii TaxID=2011161 RepID=A0A914VYM8_9BILA